MNWKRPGINLDKQSNYPDNPVNKYVIKKDANLLESPGMDHLYIRLAADADRVGAGALHQRQAAGQLGALARLVAEEVRQGQERPGLLPRGPGDLYSRSEASLPAGES